ncbi:MAG: hypothetical protein HRT74_10840 [Flavobacteriales bacterium]|nr:hypothetical protein [Flavobacteriales bacterium]
MKSLYLFAFSIFLTVSVTAQSDQPQWLQSLFGEQIESVSQEKLNYYLLADQLGYAIVDAGEKDISSYPDAYSVPAKAQGVPSVEEAIDTDDFHFLCYQFVSKHKETVHYRLGDTGKILIIYSYTYLAQKIENAQ